MQIKYLSSSDLRSFGQILPQFPGADEQHIKKQMELTADTQIPMYQATDQIVLDYISGMSLLVIYQESNTHIFYLDRVVALMPGTKFSLMPMGETCCVALLTSLQESFTPTEYVPAASLEASPQGLQFEKIYTYLYQECTHNFYFRGEKHRPFELVYVDQGELHNLVRGQDIFLKQQNFTIIDSNDWHVQYSDLPVSFLTISFWAVDSRISTITNKVFTLTPQLKGIFKRLMEKDQHGPYSNEYAESLLKLLLIDLLHSNKPEAPHSRPAASLPENSILDRAIQIISENVHQKLSLEELSSMVHVSVPYLYMLFQEHLGTSPGKYITKIRIEECKVLLRAGQLTMGQIAEQMSFSSLQHFSRQFKSVCGITPTQYIRSLR